jgi:hypothetical protein
MGKMYRVQQEIWSQEHGRYLFPGEAVEFDPTNPAGSAAVFENMGLIVPLSKQEVKDAKNSIGSSGSGS